MSLVQLSSHVFFHLYQICIDGSVQNRNSSALAINSLSPRLNRRPFADDIIWTNAG